jgi:hypothetical protein
MLFRLTRGRLLGLCTVLLSASVMAQDFIAYEGKNAIREGEGGAKKTVEGVDFWSEGAPPKKFMLLGYITDRRQKSGLIGMASMASLERDVAALTRKSGGDAVILMASDAETIGAVGTGTAHRWGNSSSGFGMAANVQKNNSKFAVLKYVTEAEAAPVVAAPSPPNAAAPASAAQQSTDPAPSAQPK